jgi:hypothetical protein
MLPTPTMLAARLLLDPLLFFIVPIPASQQPILRLLLCRLFIILLLACFLIRFCFLLFCFLFHDGGFLCWLLRLLFIMMLLACFSIRFCSFSCSALRLLCSSISLCILPLRLLLC